MNRGSLHAFEILLVFLAWMMLLAMVWNQSAIRTHQFVFWWKEQRMEEVAVAQSDALLAQHHVNPWNGCAHYDDSLHRDLPYLIEQSCLEKLSNETPTPGIFQISTRQNGNETIYFHQNANEMNCLVIARPGVLFPEKSEIILEVKACE